MDISNNKAVSDSLEAAVLVALSVNAVSGGTVGALPEGTDVKRLFKLAKNNYIIGITYPAVKRLSVPLPAEYADRWRKESAKQAAYHLIQNRQRLELKRVFEAAEIKFAGLKGYVIDRLYPQEAIRACADIDVAVPAFERKRVRKVLMENGYAEAERGANHDSYEKNGVSIEVHHHLYSETPEYYAYFKDVFDRMELCPGTRFEYRMNDLDLTVFQTMHAYRHFTGGGIGFRSILDQYLTDTNVPVPEEKLKGVLETLGIWQFYRVIRGISQKLFSGEALTEDEKFIVEYMINGGIFGTELNNASMIQSEYAGGKGSTFRYVLQRTFLPYYDMKIRYPVLEKLPLALPFCHVHRWLKAMRGYRGGIKSEIAASDSVTAADIEEKKRLKRIIGCGEE